MRILGQAQLATGERKRNIIPGWNQIKGVWRKQREQSAKQFETKMPLFAGASFTQETALAIAQRNFVSAQSVELGICDVPTSASFPDGKVHGGMDKL